MLLSKALRGLLFSALAIHPVGAVKTLYQHPETNDVTTWDQAKEFCEARESKLVTKAELCRYFTNTQKVTGDSWSAALDTPGSWLQIGVTESDYCKAYDKATECPETEAPTAAPTAGATEAPTAAPTAGATEAPTAAPTAGATEAPTAAPTAGGRGGCKRPEYCKPYETNTASCMIKEGCPELVPGAYYPDPENCAGYCFSTGTDAPCRYEVVDLNAHLVVDPYGTTYPKGGTWSDIPAGGSSAKCSGKRGNPLDGTCGITQSQTNLWVHWGIPIPNLNHCKYWPDRDGGASGNLGTPPPPTNSFRRRLEDGYLRTTKTRRLAEPERRLGTCDVDPNYILCDKTPTGSSHGDPHFSTFGDYKYDFHGGCDLVLLDNPTFFKGLGMRIHVRTKVKTWWSFIEAAAIQVGNHTLELRGGKESVQYWLDGGEARELEDGEVLFGDFPAKLTRISPHQSRIHIDLGSKKGDAISFETFNDFVRANVKAPAQENWLGSRGMLGTYPEGTLVARDGTDFLKSSNKFGQEWQVLSSEPMLFHEASDTVQHPTKCFMPEQNTKAQRRLGASALTKEDAAAACANVEPHDRTGCIFDVMATNDVNMAQAYLK